MNFIPQLCSFLGIKILILTNASGGAMSGMMPGSVMVIRDHIRATSINPIPEVAFDGRFGPRFVDLQQVYSQKLGNIAIETAKEIGMSLFEGVYYFAGGPTYETASEVRLGAKLGGCAFGMSTVTEVVAACAFGMEVLGLSLITNVAAGLLPSHVLSHAEVTAAASDSGAMFQNLLLRILQNIPADICLKPMNKPEVYRLPKVPYRVGIPFRPYVTPAHFSAVTKYLAAANTGLSNPTALLVIESGSHHSVLDFLEDKRDIPLHDLPFASTFFRSASAQCAWITIGSVNSLRLCVLWGLEKEGLDSFEATLLISAFHAFGISICVGSINAFVKSCAENTAFSSGNEESDAFLVSDFLDRTQSPFVPLPENVVPSFGLSGQSQELPYFNPTFAKHLETKYRCGSLVSWAGPCLPTPSETRFAELSESEAVSIFDPSIFRIALNLNWSVSVVAFKATYLTKITNCSFDLSWIFKGINALCARSAPLMQDNQVEPQQDAIVQIFQESFCHVEAASLHFGNFFKQVPNVVVFVESCFVDILHNFELQSILSCSDLIGWKESVAGGTGVLSSRWKIAIGREMNSKKHVLLVYHETPLAIPIPSFYQLQFLTRVLKFAGVKKALYLAPIQTVNRDIGKLLSIADHVNLAGWNPLFGHNEDRWGPRFPDMSTPYSRAMSKYFDLESAVLLQFADPFVCSSPSVASFVKKLDFAYVCCGLIPQIIVASHMQFEVSAIGFVNRSLLDSSLHVDRLSANQCLQLLAIIPAIA